MWATKASARKGTDRLGTTTSVYQMSSSQFRILTGVTGQGRGLVVPYYFAPFSLCQSRRHTRVGPAGIEPADAPALAGHPELVCHRAFKEREAQSVLRDDRGRWLMPNPTQRRAG